MSSVTGRLIYDPNADSSSHKVGAYILAGDDGTQIGHVSDALKVDIGSVSDLDIRDLTHASDSVKIGDGTEFLAVNVDGSINAVVTATQLDIDDLNATDDAVAAWLNDGSGNAIGSTGGALDVNVASGDLSVDLSHTEDSVRLGDGTNFLTSTNVGADWGLDVNLINASIVVTASDLDIRDLNSATDSVAVTDGGGSITVDASDLDIRDLTHATDSIRLGDGTDLVTVTQVNSDYGLDVNVLNDIDIDDDLADTAILGSATAVSTTAVNVVTSALANRKWIGLANEGNKTLYFGQSGVTTSNGFPVHPGDKAVWRIGPSVAPQIIGETGSSSEDLRVLELS